jgi:hypothetical protein
MTLKQIKVDGAGVIVSRAMSNVLNEDFFEVNDKQWEQIEQNWGKLKWGDLGPVLYEPEPSSVYIAPTPALCAIANFQMTDGDVSVIDLTSGFSIIFAIEPGKVWAFFETPMPDLNYSWNINSTDGRVRVTSEHTTDYLEIEAKDDGGEPLSGATVALQVYKVNS